jgi:hypothetical protein
LQNSSKDENPSPRASSGVNVAEAFLVETIDHDAIWEVAEEIGPDVVYSSNLYHGSGCPAGGCLIALDDFFNIWLLEEESQLVLPTSPGRLKLVFWDNLHLVILA